MKKVLIFILVLVILVSFFWYRKVSQYAPLEDTLIVGTTADFPPFSFRDKNDNIVGFDIDVVNEVVKRLGMEIDILDRPFKMLLPHIQLGQIHAIAAGMTPNKERAKNLYFTKPYLTGNPLLVVSLSTKPIITELEDLKGKNIVVNTGYTADIYMSKLPDVNLIRLEKVADAFAAIEHNKADAFVTAHFTIKPYLKELNKEESQFNIFRIYETDENIALGISKKLPKNFFEKIENALDSMEKDGTLYALKQKWEVV